MKPRPEVRRQEVVLEPRLPHLQDVVEDLLDARVVIGLKETQSGGSQLSVELLQEVRSSKCSSGKVDGRPGGLLVLGKVKLFRLEKKTEKVEKQIKKTDLNYSESYS